jgi:hypothetical protein
MSDVRKAKLQLPTENDYKKLLALVSKTNGAVLNRIDTQQEFIFDGRTY